MRTRSLVVSLSMVFAVMLCHAGDSAPFVLDNAMSPSGESVILQWNAEWIGGNVNATVVITDNGTEVKRATGSGEFMLNISCGNHLLEYATFISGVKQGETYTAQAELAHVAAETKSAKAATCTEDGWTKEVSCSRCKVVLVASTVLPKLGHSASTTVSKVEPTCTTEGMSAEIACSRCNEILQSRSVLPSLGHSGAITKHAVAPTSSSLGLTAEITCTRCAQVLQKQEDIPALGYIRNITARQIWPHKKIEIMYELAEDIEDVLSPDTALSLTAKYGATTKSATSSRIYGNLKCIPGVHRVVWDFESQSVAINQSSVVISVAYGLMVAQTAAIVVNTSSSVKDGMSIEGSLSIDYSPFADGVTSILIDGNKILSSTNSGVFAWQPQTTGTHTIKHISGDYEWTRTVNVTSLAFEPDPTPNPPTGIDSNIKINSTTKSFAQAGGTGAITTSGSGTLAVNASADWITITSASSAGRPIAYKVAANNSAESRTGYIYISGYVFTVTQEGVGGVLDIYSAEFETDGGRGVFGVIVDAGVTWKAQSNVDWISVDSTVGTGEGEVAFTVAPWDEVSTRVGTITAAGNTFTVTQTGRRMKLSNNVIEYDYLSHVIDVQVNALSTTSWDIELGASWISIVDGGRGNGSDDVFLAINENPSYAPRQGVVRIGTEKLLITQTGRPTEALDFSISPEEATASVDGANAVLAVAATPDLPWEAKSESAWLTIMPSFKSGSGNGNVIYTASPNPTMVSRTGRITVLPAPETGVSALTHTVTQAAATALISADEHTFDAAGSSFDVEVTVADVVKWSIVKDSSSWVTISGSLSCIGPDRVTIAAQENLTTENREATVTMLSR